MKHKVFRFLKSQDKPLSRAEIAHLLDIPATILHEHLTVLQDSGKIREISLDQIISEGK
ncbi:MAG: helix-turn-helix transcriptional regulator [Candidatus Altiarchaeales archaeon]|nr:helix-turn-helix transcriptional regulator [Candidatus Altiarchaeales archaeon]